MTESLLSHLNLSISLGGLRVKILSLIHVFPNPQWQVPCHSHPDLEIHMIPQGKGTVECEGSRFSVQAGDFYLTGPCIRHAQQTDPADPMEEFCLECEIEAAPEEEADPLSVQEATWLRDTLYGLYPRGFRDGTVFRMLEEMLREDRERRPGYVLRLETLTVDLLLRIFRTAAEKKEAFVYRYPQDADDRRDIRRIIRYVQENYPYSMRLEDVSRTLYLSPRQINRLMNKFFSVTFHAYLMQYRLNAARELLCREDCSVEEVAERAGFRSHYYMYQAFRRAGMPTPAAIRRSGR